MSNVKQSPQLATLTAGQSRVFSNKTSITIMPSGAAATVSNGSESIVLPDGLSLEITADNGNVLVDIEVTSGGSSVFVSAMS